MTVKDDVESAGAVKTNGTASKPLFLTGVLFDSIVRVFDGFLSTNSTLGVLLYRNVHLRRCRTLGKRNTGSNANGIGIIARGNKAGVFNLCETGIDANVRGVVLPFRSRPHNKQIVKAGVIDNRGLDVDVHSGNHVIVFAHWLLSSLISASVK